MPASIEPIGETECYNQSKWQICDNYKGNTQESNEEFGHKSILPLEKILIFLKVVTVFVTKIESPSASFLHIFVSSIQPFSLVDPVFLL